MLNNVKESIIVEKLKNSNEFKAFGVDQVCNAVLKNSAEDFLKPLKLVFDKSLSTGERWCVAHQQLDKTNTKEDNLIKFYFLVFI